MNRLNVEMNRFTYESIQYFGESIQSQQMTPIQYGNFHIRAHKGLLNSAELEEGKAAKIEVLESLYIGGS